MITEFEEDYISYCKTVLKERLRRIAYIINYYGEDNFYISYSGGKDSSVLSKLVDMALPDNNIPRVYVDTGIELNIIREFVKKQAEDDWRIEIVKPTKNIKQILEENGYPFKSKEHSYFVYLYQTMGEKSDGWKKYVKGKKGKRYSCPKQLKYQFKPDFKLKLSKKCCEFLKEKPLKEWEKEHKKYCCMLGIMRDEGGARQNAQCLSVHGRHLHFQPLIKVSKMWEDWFCKEYNVELCDIYKPPYNFHRTGCKGCPFGLKLATNLQTLEKFFPNERKQCEYIWKPVYDEYRRIGYRLKE